ncbi:MAG: endonuclease/exonuclease/phosphatase family protein [Phycisphaerae bacterium]
MAGRGAELRVMSFNIMKARSDRRSGPWDVRKQPVGMAIRAFGPDLLGAQEVQSFQAEYLRGELREYGFVSAGRNSGMFAGESVAILFRSDRFERLDEGHFWLSKRPEVPGSRNWGSVVPRMVSWVQLRDSARKRPLFLFNAHFDPLSWRARMRSVWVLRQQIVRLAGRLPVIVTGDFNTQAGNKTYSTVLGGMNDGGLELIDAYRSAHRQKERYEGTWHGPSGRRARRRIDWVLHTRHFKTIRADIDRDRRNDRFPSDHFPVTAVLGW